ncbi:MAG: ribonuclease III [Micavibrio sp.]|nr:ribonuclease III [Micavibrio sp.]|tara:strand:- start:107824 stop:108522 length:699 start_codon:yes stop_codon:yes gene_type:complete
MADAQLDKLQALIGYSFKDGGLLERAITHASASSPNYERLEFLGDRVLGLIIANDIFQRFPNEKEGMLARRLSALVCRPMLASVGVEMGLGDFIRTQEHDFTQSNPDGSLLSENEKVLSDVIEALLGAIFLDGGLASCATFVKTHWGDRLNKINRPAQDPKTALQEFLQADGHPVPDYVLVGQSGPDHAPLFEIAVQVEGLPPATASGTSKRAAEKAAAKKMLDILQGKSKK